MLNTLAVGPLKYVFAGLFAAVLALTVVVGIQSYRIQGKNLLIQTKETELAVSKASIKTLEDSLKNVQKEVEEKARQDKARQAEIARSLKVIEGQNKKLERLEDRLLSRQSTSDCKVPEDLKDAWTRL